MTEKMTLIAEPGQPTITFTRTFNAPRELVFAAWTTPEHVKRWFGPRVFTVPVCEIDLRPGGAYRWVLRGPAGTEFAGDSAMAGVYREVAPPERLVCTEFLEDSPESVAVVTLTFEERDGKTLLTSRSVYRSVEDRDAHLGLGMEPGLRETLDRLAEHLSTMATVPAAR
jgi:uncharacterized protein YndB with AHSA1/START domain